MRLKGRLLVRGFSFSVCLAALATSALGQATTFWVNNEFGLDCYNGLAAVPNDLCTIGQPPIAGPFRRITRALQEIATTTLPAPYVVRIAGRTDAAGNLILYNASQTSEVFPLVVPLRTTLTYDLANSDRLPGGGSARVVIEGPLPTSAGAPGGLNTIEFNATGGQTYGTDAGIDGTGGTSGGYGIEIRGGERGVFLNCTGAGSQMGIVIRWVDLTGTTPGTPQAGTGNGLDAHATDGGLATFEVTNCRVGTEQALVQAPAGGAALEQPALIHLLSNQVTPGLRPDMSPRITATIVRFAGTAIVEVSAGLRYDAVGGATGTPFLSGLDLQGNSNVTPGTPQGITTGVLFTLFQTNAGLRVDNNTQIRTTGQYGLRLLTTGLSPARATLNVLNSAFSLNGRRAQQPAATFPGAAIAVELPVAQSAVDGTISNNTFFQDRVGILFFTNAAPPASGGPSNLTVSRNTIEQEQLNPTSLLFGSVRYDGAAIAIAADGGGVFDTDLRFESNILLDNQGEGAVLVVPSLSSLSTLLTPVFRNDRIYRNGTAVGAPARDGVLTWVPVTGGLLSSPVLRAFFVHETIFDNAGYGVNNPNISNAASQSEVWNSILWDNNGPVTFLSADVNGIFLPGTPGNSGGTVQNSNLCGVIPFVGCGGQQFPTAGNSGCISWPPSFVDAAGGNFELACAALGCPPPNPPACNISCTVTPSQESIDRGTTGAPFFPLLDALGQDRTVCIRFPGDPPDMGAIEKQTSCP